MKPLSRMAENFPESAVCAMGRLCEDAGGNDLALDFSDFDGPLELEEAAVHAVRDKRCWSPIGFGEPGLREAVAAKAFRYNGIAGDPETDVTVTGGVGEAITATLRAICNPGDEIIVFEPFREHYAYLSFLSEVTPRYVTLYKPDRHFNPKELAEVFNDRTKAIIINTPHNPTGKVFSKTELETIAALCNKWNVYAIADEIYEHILYDDAEHVSIGSLPGMEDRTITVNSIEKTYSVEGWGVGWAIADKRITDRIRKVLQLLSMGAPTPLQHAAVTALNFENSYYKNLKHRYTQARSFIHALLSECGFSFPLPAGAFHILADISEVAALLGTDNDVEFSKKLFAETGVATAPGSSFYSRKESGVDQVRFCYGKKPETLDAVAESFRDFFCVHQEA
ncbi:MAG: aminotransferase class I/II-fold pyridoxal phosphate-dependent enzyme, partial [Chitinivibrionales bacterium]|nr:aminotransferase class I/II-fold pyridoxal phosphate-dependent enzyme [Chitinivibrionales bacterium]